MDKIIIRRNTNGDTRVAAGTPFYSDFVESNEQHIDEVSSLMTLMAAKIHMAGERHDWTKISQSKLFYKEFSEAMDEKINFEEGEWYPMHYTSERHHLHKHVPMDVNLIDVIEMIADCICAGLARSGEVRPITIDANVLAEAFNNTVGMMQEYCELDSDDYGFPNFAQDYWKGEGM